MKNQKPQKSESNAQQPKLGRPPLIVEDEKTLTAISGLSRIQCTHKEAADVLGVSRSTFTTFLTHSKKASEAWEMGSGQGKASLRRNQFEMSKTNATMAIWLGKQYLEQVDRRELEVGNPGDFDRMSRDELREYIQRETQELGIGRKPATGLGGSGAARSKPN
jgi:hypothetical protein